MPPDMDPGLGRAVAAAGIVALLYAAGGIPRLFAGALLLSVLVIPGPNGRSMATNLISFANSRLLGASAEERT